MHKNKKEMGLIGGMLITSRYIANGLALFLILNESKFTYVNW